MKCQRDVKSMRLTLQNKKKLYFIFQKINGTNLANFEAHIAEIMWRNHHKDENIYEAFFNYLRTVYTLHQSPRLTYPTPLFGTWQPNVKKNDHRDVIPDSDAEELESDEDEIDLDMPVPEAPIDLDTPVVLNASNPGSHANISNSSKKRRRRANNLATNLEIAMATHKPRYNTRSAVCQTRYPISPKLTPNRRSKGRIRVNEKMCYPQGFQPLN